MHNILMVCGSLGQTSSNRTLLLRCAELAPWNMRLNFFEGLAALPHFNTDIDPESVEAVGHWRQAIAKSSALLIACPEYGHSLPGVLKNGVDWVIGTGELEEKVVAMTASVPGPERGLKGLEALRGTLNAVRAHVGGQTIVRGETADEQIKVLLGELQAQLT